MALDNVHNPLGLVMPYAFTIRIGRFICRHSVRQRNAGREGGKRSLEVKTVQ